MARAADSQQIAKQPKQERLSTSKAFTGDSDAPSSWDLGDELKEATAARSAVGQMKTPKASRIPRLAAFQSRLSTLRDAAERSVSGE